MEQQGRITIRGPFEDDKRDKWNALINGHPFNSEVVYFIPSFHSNMSEFGQSSELGFFDEGDEDTFLTVNPTRNIQSILAHKSEFYYRVSGPFVCFLEEPFYSTYVAGDHGLTLTTVNTPRNECNTLCIVNGQYLVITMDASSVSRLGLVGKHVSSRYFSKDNYIVSIQLKGLSSSSKLMRRVRECLSNIAPLTMECFSESGEIAFPTSIHAEKITNQSSQHRSSTIPIPRVTAELLMNAMAPFGLDVHSLPLERYLSLKQSKQFDREQVIAGLLDWMGCVLARCNAMQVHIDHELSRLHLSDCFQYEKEESFVDIVKSNGWIPSSSIIEKVELLNSQVQKGQRPFAMVFLAGSRECGVQWIVGKTPSEYQFLQDDDAHLVLLLLPQQKRFALLLSSDVESRLYLV